MANATIAPITASATTGSVHRRTSLRSCCGCTAPDDLLLTGLADPARHPRWADHGRFGHKECEYKRARGGYDGAHGAERAEALVCLLYGGRVGLNSKPGIHLLRGTPTGGTHRHRHLAKAADATGPGSLGETRWLNPGLATYAHPPRSSAAGVAGVVARTRRSVKSVHFSPRIRGNG